MAQIARGPRRGHVRNSTGRSSCLTRWRLAWKVLHRRSPSVRDGVSPSAAVAVMLAVIAAKRGGDGWESNPPRTPQQRPANGFEDRGRHQSSFIPDLANTYFGCLTDKPRSDRRVLLTPHRQTTPHVFEDRVSNVHQRARASALDRSWRTRIRRRPRSSAGVHEIGCQLGCQNPHRVGKVRDQTGNRMPFIVGPKCATIGFWTARHRLTNVLRLPIPLVNSVIAAMRLAAST
jgi:hypothetical protein